MSAVVRVSLSDEVERFVVNHEDIDESFAVLNVATDYAIAHGEPMTLRQALATIHCGARKIEVLDEPTA